MKIESKLTIQVTIDGTTLNLTQTEAKTLLQHLKNALGENTQPLFPVLPLPVPKKEKGEYPWVAPGGPWAKPYDTHNWPPGTVLCGQ